MSPTVTPYLLYEDVEAALDFLARAFGFEELLRYTGPEGYVNHAEMRIGEDGVIYMGDPGEQYRNPAHLGVRTHMVCVTVDNVDAAYEQAKAAVAPQSSGATSAIGWEIDHAWPSGSRAMKRRSP